MIIGHSYIFFCEVLIQAFANFFIELSLNNPSFDTSQLIKIPTPIKEKGISSYREQTVMGGTMQLLAVISNLHNKSKSKV